MIDEIALRNFVLVEECTISFTEGLNILSGETGSGKSIIASSLAMLCGCRGDAKMVRTGCDECQMTGRFFTQDPEVLEWLRSHGISDDDGSVLVRRTLRKNGRGSISIQKTSITRDELAEFASLMLDIHGQHEQYTLVNQTNQMRLLDSGAGLGKELSEMSLSELWELFPIFLVEHNDEWKSNYKEIEEFLGDILSDYPITKVSHIGSTAINDIWAKDIVDVLIEISPSATLEEVAQTIEQSGFMRISSEKNRISLNRGYTKEGFADKVYHVHLRYEGDNDELYFRDYLNAHPNVAKEYEALKMELWKKY